MKNSITILSRLNHGVKKALQAIYGDLRDKRRFTFAEFIKTREINLSYGTPNFRKLSRGWRYLLDETLIEMNILRRYKTSNYYVKIFTTLQGWANFQANDFVGDIQKLEKNGILNAVRKEKIKRAEKTGKVLEIEKKFRKPINILLAGLYIGQNLSSYQIAEKFGVSNATILTWLKRYGIKIREEPARIKPSKKELTDLYVKQHKSTLQIAKQFNISVSTAHKWLKDHGIKTRDRSSAQLRKGVVKPTKKELKKLYIDQKLSISEIARRLNYPQPTIHKWLREYIR